MATQMLNLLIEHVLYTRVGMNRRRLHDRLKRIYPHLEYHHFLHCILDTIP